LGKYAALLIEAALMDCKLNSVEKKVVEPMAAQEAVPRKALRLYFLCDIILIF